MLLALKASKLKRVNITQIKALIFIIFMVFEIHVAMPLLFIKIEKNYKPRIGI
jgi:hypothetical protein